MYRSPYRLHNRKYFYKYTSAETAYINLTSNTIRLSSPKILNDPFDVVRTIKMPFSKFDISKLLLNRLIYLIKNNVSSDNISNPKNKYVLDNFNKIDIIEQDKIIEQIKLDDLLAKPIQDLDFSEVQKIWLDRIPYSRILSLTEENDNPVMWSSYSNNYQGVVLELECLDIYDSVLLLAEPVKYSDEDVFLGTEEYWLDSILGIRDFDYDETFKKLETIKKNKWSYEKEWRVISYDKNSINLYSDYKLPRNTFTKVLFGKDIDMENKLKILKLHNIENLKYIEFFDMNINYHKQEIEFKKIT